MLLSAICLGPSSSVQASDSWNTTTDLSATGEDASDPQIAASSDGTKLTAIWYRRSGANYIIQTRSGSAGAGALTPVWRVTLDPNGGSCIDSTERYATWTSVFVGFRYLPNATDCTRDGDTFEGWASTDDPTTVVSLPTLTDPSDGQRRMFLAANADLVAVWSPDITPINDLFVFANFLCGPCTNAWLLFTMPTHATAFDVALNDISVTCTQSGNFYGLSLCELTDLTPGDFTASLTPRVDTTTDPPTSTVITLRP